MAKIHAVGQANLPRERCFAAFGSMRLTRRRYAGCGRCIRCRHVWTGDEEPDIVPFRVDALRRHETRGHRFLCPQPFKVRRLDDYAAKAREAKVVLDRERRMEMIPLTPRTRFLRKAMSWWRILPAR